MLNRLTYEFGGLAQTLDALSFAKYLGLVALHLPQILRTRNLVPADRGMRSRIRVKTWREDIILDCAALDDAMPSFDETMVFTLARELCGRNVYLRPFQPFTAAGQTVIDLGANRGLFSAVAAAALAPVRIVAVEPLAGYQPVQKLLIRPDLTKIEWVTGFVGDAVGTGEGQFRFAPEIPSVSVASLLAANERVALIKIDIEGGEEALFRNAGDWLPQVDRITMEVHQGWCDTAFVYDALEKAGFAVFAANDVGARVPHNEADFFYAARDQALFADRYH